MKLFSKFITCAAAAMLSLNASAATPVADHVVFIGLDGWAGNLYDNYDMPTVKKLAAEGALTTQKRSVLPSSSAINWASIFMGVPAEVHGYLQWGSRTPDMQQPQGAVTKHSIMPTIFQVARDSKPDADLALFAQWEGIKYLVDTLSITHHRQLPADKLTDEACAYITANKPQLTAIIYDTPDHPGHDTGWGSPEYYEALKNLDTEIARIVDAVKKAGMTDNTVFIISSDHGGKGTGHGGTSMDEMNAPLIVSGKGIKSGITIDELTMSPDITSLIARILSIDPHPIWRGHVPQSIFK